MATTTNYSWETPDDTDLVKDGAAAMRTLGNSIDTTTKALNPSTTLGDIEYRSSTANTNTRLAVGTNGQVLTVASGVPSWATPAGGGKVLQVVYGSTTTQTANSTSTYADTTLSATITPSASSSKVLVLVSQNGVSKDTGNTGAQLRLLRGATVIQTFSGSVSFTNSTTPTRLDGVSSTHYLDSPATTSATTYKTQFASRTNTAVVQVQVTGGDDTSSIILMEIGA